VQEEWQHLAITYDELTSEKILYVDGIPVASTIDQFYAPVTTAERLLHIGGGGDLGTEFRWVGDIDDIGIWNEVLGEDEIVEVMNDGVQSLDGPAPVGFRRGDVDGNGARDITDPVGNLAFQFTGGFQPGCLDALDWDDNGMIEITDPIGDLSHQFLGGPPSPPPGGETCGPDPTGDGLGCEQGCR
jgi:hypothetical protein